ncbi:MAG: hypothetical protein QXQ91_03510 [Nanopusillaceae archaeon]
MSPEHFKIPSLEHFKIASPVTYTFVDRGPLLTIDVITPYEVSRSITREPQLTIDVITPYEVSRSITVALETEVS